MYSSVSSFNLSPLLIDCPPFVEVEQSSSEVGRSSSEAGGSSSEVGGCWSEVGGSSPEAEELSPEVQTAMSKVAEAERVLDAARKELDAAEKRDAKMKVKKLRKELAPVGDPARETGSSRAETIFAGAHHASLPSTVLSPSYI